MVDNKLIAISYICFFIFVFLCSIVYSILPQVSKINVVQKLPQTTYTMEMSSAMSSINLTGSWSPLVLICIAIIVVFMLGSFTTFRAYD